MSSSYKAPACPKCGSEDVQVWELVPVPSQVARIGPGGEIEHDLYADNRPAWEGGTFDEIRCRACDHATEDPRDFRPADREETDK